MTHIPTRGVETKQSTDYSKPPTESSAQYQHTKSKRGLPKAVDKFVQVDSLRKVPVVLVGGAHAEGRLRKVAEPGVGPKDGGGKVGRVHAPERPEQIGGSNGACLIGRGEPAAHRERCLLFSKARSNGSGDGIDMSVAGGVSYIQFRGSKPRSGVGSAHADVHTLQPNNRTRARAHTLQAHKQTTTQSNKETTHTHARARGVGTYLTLLRVSEVRLRRRVSKRAATKARAETRPGSDTSKTS